MERVIDVQQWMEQLGLNRAGYSYGDSLCVVFAYLLHLKLYYLGETSHSMHPDVAKQVSHYLKQCRSMVDDLAERWEAYGKDEVK